MSRPLIRAVACDGQFASHAAAGWLIEILSECALDDSARKLERAIQSEPV
jgi:hypothetical protein